MQLGKDIIASELEEGKTLFISQGDDVWTPTFLAGTKEHVCYHTSEARQDVCIESRRKTAPVGFKLKYRSWN